MEIKIVDKTTVKDYIDFCKGIYQDNENYRDIMSGTLKEILLGKAEICKSTTIEPIMVIESGRIVAVCTFAIVDRMKDVLQIAYFEALEKQEQAVDFIMEYGKKVALKHQINQILVGLNFHVNYGLGLLASSYDELQSFGSAYNPPYYIDYFSKYAHEEIKLMSYLKEMKNLDFKIKERLLNKVTAKYQVRKANFKDLKREAAIYTEINNRAFKNHRFYYERRLAEDLELFQEFKLFLKEENLLFLEYNGEAIGFMLWYPDFNQLMKPQESIGLKTLIKSKLFANKINRFKIVEIGVLPEYQKTGAVLSLFLFCHGLTKGRYQYCEAGWILEENYASKGFGIRWADEEYKQYKVFLINL
ncbi:hypothetical protein [Alkaliphilus transvaalensis]|uniref:hypothetical protein n=1 Tax=Alkaliphilus transvaalensis TaxID=114628 RepID=UPI000479B462|nr:hypothetical protein [Alkaliphilus transvaalensis]